ncbi:hypothetical protein EYZ11_004504 [Aspergillus tanneri]|uniref:Peptidase S8/S53 domain-containing protein n=1 Tax=Aspergillus tanneri TaxID=1220188 RepID=A0A4S3JKU3_9EURO|nr:hypothetical protein EYZ11_004504 [Aspergillus tanneri]
MSVISFNGNNLDPEAQRPVLRALGLELEDASKSDYILLQSVEPLSIDQEVELEKLGVDIHEYVSKNTYLCGFKDANLQPIRTLRYVSWVNVYLNLFVVESSLKSPAGVMEQSIFPTVPKDRTTQKVDILFHKDVDTNSPDILSAIAAAAHADAESLDAEQRKVRLNVESQNLDGLASLDQVKILGCPVQVNGTEYEGQGQIVAVADTGFDKGSTVDTHPAFKGRVRQLHALGRHNKSDDPDGHGTHVCGSVLGDGYSALMGGKIRGAAPKANLVIQSLLDRNNALGGIPTNLKHLFYPPYKENDARVHTNSWGSSAPRRKQLAYNTSSIEIDRFVWDHKDMVILFAAGNDGIDADKNGIVDPRQIGAEAASKNCITVGASENNHPEIPITYGARWPKGPISKDLMADHPEGLAAFSSRGPTLEDRIKPDVVAPGTAILSARSRNLIQAEANFGTSLDPEWWYLAGTSMATPLVAGCAAILREILVDKNKIQELQELQKPSAALIKALLINGAVELPGQYVPSEAGPSPNGNSGFGRVNLSNSFILPDKLDGGYREGGPLAQGAVDEIEINIPTSEKPENVQDRAASTTVPHGAVLKVSLVWTDYPGEKLQNDLDLIVVCSDGTEKHGNMGDSKNFDRTNNVEQVVWENLPPGNAKIIVRAYHIFKRDYPQPYAVVWSINRPLK